MSESPEYLNTAQIAAELGVNAASVQKHFRSGSLPGRLVGGGWRTTRAALDAWLLAGNTADAPLEGTDNGLRLETKD